MHNYTQIFTFHCRHHWNKQKIHPIPRKQHFKSSVYRMINFRPRHLLMLCLTFYIFVRGQMEEGSLSVLWGRKGHLNEGVVTYLGEVLMSYQRSLSHYKRLISRTTCISTHCLKGGASKRRKGGLFFSFLGKSLIWKRSVLQVSIYKSIYLSCWRENSHLVCQYQPNKYLSIRILF